jgi:hypothetical protein
MRVSPKKCIWVFPLLLAAAACTSEQFNQKPSGNSSPPEQPAVASVRRAAEYTVLSVKDVSTWTLEKDSKPSRKILEVVIMSNAKTFDARGQVVVAACKAAVADGGAQAVRVQLEPNENTSGLGFVLAIATYSPDGKGRTGTENGVIWDDSSSSDYQPSAKALRLTKDSRLGDISMEQARVIAARRPFNPN